MQPHHTFGTVRIYLGNQSGKYPDGNQIIVQGTDTRIAFDTPQVSRHIGADLDGIDLLLLGHVHEDHMVSVGRLRHAPMQVHEADLAAAQSWEGMCQHFGYTPEVLANMLEKIRHEFDYAPRPDATAYQHGQQWTLGGGVRIRAHHLPGHTAGHCALIVENEGLAFIGDIDLTGFGPYYGDQSSNLSQFQASLAQLQTLDARIWVTSHHRGVLTDRTEFLRQLALFSAKINERSQRLLDYLRERPHSLDELVTRRMLYPPHFQQPFVDGVERRSITMHLELLQQQGQVQVEHPDSDSPRYHIV